ncbi:MAG: acylneuraminate cytidylyltransferase family protein [Desulfobacterales bacterium]|nr:acylneuraminate cytidylyltransferase family protein [Desulfobacterales bacterium]
MFDGKKILAIIPARGGSKGVSRKNIKIAGGKPLIAWVIEAAKKSKHIDRLILSSDDDEIIKVAESFGCDTPFVRPKEFAQDRSTVADVIIHALNKIPDFDYIMLLQPTSPLTLAEDIDGCIDFCIKSKAQSVVSVAEPGKNPYWTFTMEQDNQLVPVFGNKYFNQQRQEVPIVYMPTGAIYMAESKWFLENKSFYSAITSGYLIPKERSLDIDSELDFKVFEAIMSDIIDTGFKH